MSQCGQKMMRDAECSREESALGLSDVCIVRILGNDLAPRQRVGQTLENTRWLLEHEQDYPSCRKLWILNRIVDPSLRDELKALVSDYRQGYIEIPFVPEEYRAQPLRPYTDDQLRQYLGCRGNADKKSMQYTLAVAVLQARLNYAIGINGARNLALRHGGLYGRWVLPLDGNCFMDGAGWQDLLAYTRSARHAGEGATGRHIVSLPMARITDNSQLQEGAAALDYDQEPQLAFQRYADVQFDEHYYYSRRDKVELLWRLGIPGVWDTYRDCFFDPPRHPPGELAGLYAGSAGHVVRLASGTEHAAISSGERHELRLEAIVDYLAQLDQQFGIPPSQQLNMAQFTQRLHHLF